MFQYIAHVNGYIDITPSCISVDTISFCHGASIKTVDYFWSCNILICISLPQGGKILVLTAPLDVFATGIWFQ